MNHTKFFGYSIVLVFATLATLAIVLSGCASPATPAATTEPLVCPTAEPLSCPTASAELQPPVLNSWRWGFSEAANYVITFEPGDKCTMEVINPKDGNKITYEIVVNDQTYQNYMVAAVKLAEGKDFKDLEAYNSAGGENNTNPPAWSDLQVLEIVSPMSRTFHGLPPMEGTVYFVCFVQGPDDQRIIKTFEGIQISGN